MVGEFVAGGASFQAPSFGSLESSARLNNKCFMSLRPRRSVRRKLLPSAAGRGGYHTRSRFSQRRSFDSINEPFNYNDLPLSCCDAIRGHEHSPETAGPRTGAQALDRAERLESAGSGSSGSLAARDRRCGRHGGGHGLRPVSYTPILPAMISTPAFLLLMQAWFASANFTISRRRGACRLWLGGRAAERGSASRLCSRRPCAACRHGITSSGALPNGNHSLSCGSGERLMIFISGIVAGAGARCQIEHVPSVAFRRPSVSPSRFPPFVCLDRRRSQARGPFEVAGRLVRWRSGRAGGYAFWWPRCCRRAVTRHRRSTGGAARRSRPLMTMTLTYGLFGFRLRDHCHVPRCNGPRRERGHSIEFLSWLITGVSAALSVYLCAFAMPRLGLAGVYAAGLLVEAAGLILTVSLPSPFAPLVGGLMLAPPS